MSSQNYFAILLYVINERMALNEKQTNTNKIGKTMKKNINLNNNKKLNIIREFSEMLGYELEGYEHACDELVIRAALNAGLDICFTKTSFTVSLGKEKFTIRFKNGIDAEALQFRVTDLYINTIKKLSK